MAATAHRPIGVILAGGMSSRMGSDKASMPFKGMPMAAWVAAALRQAGCEPMVAGGPPLGDVAAVPDAIPGRPGPAAGLVTVLRLAGGRDTAVVATDQPLVRHQTIGALLALEGDVVVPVDHGIPQTTCAVYRAACLEPLERGLADPGGYSLRDLVATCATREVPPDEWASWGEDGRSWWSIDTPAALAAAQRWRPGDPVPGRARRRPRRRQGRAADSRPQP